MPLFFFDTLHNGGRSVDDEGLEMSDRQRAREQAIQTLPFMALDELADGPSHDFGIEVRDASGRIFFEASLSFRANWVASSEV